MLDFFDHSSESLFNRLIFITRWILNWLFKTLSLALRISRFFLISRNSVLLLHLFKFLSLLFNIIWKFWKWTLKFFQNFIFIKFVTKSENLEIILSLSSSGSSEIDYLRFSAFKAFWIFSSLGLSSSKIELISSINLEGITYLSSFEFSKILDDKLMLLKSL